MPGYLAAASGITGHLSGHAAFRVTGREVIFFVIVMVGFALMLVIPMVWGEAYDGFSGVMDKAARPTLLFGLGVLIVGLLTGVRIITIAGGAIMGAIVVGWIAEKYLTAPVAPGC